MIRTDGLSSMAAGRLKKALDKRYRFEDGAATLREWLESQAELVKTEGDGMVRFSRSKYNRMDGREQDAYEAALREERHYYVNDVEVPKIVYDAVQ